MQEMQKTRKEVAAAGTCKRQAGRNAFSMIEILVVIMIIAILLGIGLGVGRMLLADADKTLTITNMKIITSALERYKDEKERYPDKTKGDYTDDAYWANALFNNDSCKSILIEINSDYITRDASNNYTLLDGFDSAIQYSQAGGLAGMPRLTSAGPDGDFGTTDDIYSDKE